MDAITLVQGDRDDIRQVMLYGLSNFPAIASLEGHLWRREVPAHQLVAVTLTDVSQGIASVNFGGETGWLHDAMLGSWHFEIQALFPGSPGPRLTWPEGTPDRVVVRASGR